MKIQIRAQQTRRVLFSVTAESLREAVEAAVRKGVALTGADLTGAALAGAALSGARLGHALLVDADLTEADLSGATLTYTFLTGANLEGANLTNADLTGAHLFGVRLRHAQVTGANLADVRHDLWAILSAAPAEVGGLRAAVLAGKIDGYQYAGECACLVGTIAKLQGVDYYHIPDIEPEERRPAERFFLAIRPGDTPTVSSIAQLVVEWIDQWGIQHGIDFSKEERSMPVVKL